MFLMEILKRNIRTEEEFTLILKEILKRKINTEEEFKFTSELNMHMCIKMPLHDLC